MAKLTATVNNDVLSKDLATASAFKANAFTGVKVSYANATSAVVADLEGILNNAGYAAGDTYSGVTGVIGSKFNDALYGLNANSYLNGGAGNDYLEGSDRNDTLIGGAGSDTLEGGLGNDVFMATNSDGTDFINGGVGIDTVNYSAVTTPLLIALNGQKFYPQDQIIGVENAIGGSNADRIFGNASANSLDGKAGDDLIRSGAGNDTILGGDGYDYAEAGDDNDFVNGGAGGDDLFGGNGNDTILGGDGYDYAEAGDDNDFVNGGAGGDDLLGGNGNDTLLGGAGDDRLTAGEGVDILTGGAGVDFITLFETVMATDVVRIAAGESTPTVTNPTFFDSIMAFNLGNGVSTIGVDKLDLASTLIASNTTGMVQGLSNPANGTGAFAQFTISHGLMSLYDSAGKVLPVTLQNASEALAFVSLTNEYLNVLPNANTVALIVDDVNTSTGVLTGLQGTVVFQDVANSIADTVVMLQGWEGDNHVMYSSLIATGL
jgi:Ca2+-binding RTX toxin-like protein